MTAAPAVPTNLRSREYWIVERTPGNAFAIYKCAEEAKRVRLADLRIGPFESIAAAADYLSHNATLSASYEIERVERIP